jgi:hypothetical protein
MRTVLLRSAARLVGVVVCALLLCVACEEPTDPSLEPKFEETPPQQAASQPTTSNSTGSLAGRGPVDIRKAAEGGDAAAMVILGRSYQSLGQMKDARNWYAKSAEAGNEDGKAALASLDAPAPRPTTTATDVAATRPSSPDATANRIVPSSAAKRRATSAPAPAADPTKVRWVDVTFLLDFEDMLVKTDPDVRGRFMGVTTARDNTITVAAMGNSADDLDEVTAVVRVRNKLDPATSPRVGQAGSVAALVTKDNVNQREFIEWVTQYLQSGQRSEPIFRNGWRIMVSGSAGEGKQDKREYLGTAVMVEMKR